MYQMMENEKECEEHKMVEKTMDKIVAAMNNPAVHGDEYAQVQIEVPTHLSQTAKEKLQEYARACS